MGGTSIPDFYGIFCRRKTWQAGNPGNEEFPEAGDDSEEL
jgi:hypothetical protein